MRYSALRRVTSNAGMLLLGNMLRMLFTMVFVVYAARVLGVAGFGTYALAQNLIELALSLSATGLGILVTRETAKEPRWLERHLVPALVLVMGLSVAAGGVLVLLASLAGYSPDTRLAVLIGVFSLLPAAVSVLAEAVLVALDKAKYVGFGIAGESFLRVAVGFAVLLLGFGIASLFVALIATRLVQLLFYAFQLSRRLAAVNWRVTLSSFRGLVREWRVFALENWLSTLYLSLDVVFLSLFHGEAAVGIYEAAHKLIRFGAVAARCFTTVVFPYITRLHMDAKEMFDRVNVQSTRYILAAILPVAIVTTLLAPQIVMVVFDQQYTGSVPVLQVLAWVLIPQFLNPFLSHVLFARGDQRQSLVVAAVALAVFLTAAVLLIPTWGAVGTAWASLLASMTALGCYLSFVFMTTTTNANANRSASGEHRCSRRPISDPVIAVIGCGLIAERYHLPGLAKIGRALERAILVDPDAARTARLAEQFGVRGCAVDIAEVIDEIDAAIVAVPPALHFPICTELLSRGVHVLCEKPLADTAEKATALVSQADRHGAVLCVNQTRRLYPAYATIRRLLAEGVIGTLSQLRYEEGFEFYWPAASAFHFRSGARGSLLDTGIHGLDVICWWLGGKPDLVSSENDSFGGPEALARLRLQFGACRAELKLSWLNRLANRFEIVGTQGTIAGRIDVWDRVVIEHRGGRREEIRLPACERKYDEFGTRMIENFLEVIAGKAEPLVPGSEVLSALELMDEAYGTARRLPMPWLQPQKELCHA